MINTTRHLKRNLALPINERGTVENDYGKRLNLSAWRTLRQVRNDIAPKVVELRRKQDLLDRILRISNGIEKDGFSVLHSTYGDKYNGHLYALGTIETPLDTVNDWFASIRKNAMNKARENTQATDNSEALKG